MGGRLRELVLWVGAALGLLAVTAGIAVAFFGVNLLVFRSGSMSPEIPTGGLALARTVPAAELRVGDVVSVTAASGERITHRVVTSTLQGEEASLVLQGDANATPDEEIYQVVSAERVVASVPWGGYLLVHAMTPPGLVAAGAVGLMLALIGFSPAAEVDRSPSTPVARRSSGPTHRAPSPRRRPARRTRLVAIGAVSLTLVGAVVGMGSGVERTWARFTDQGTVLSGAYTSASLPAPTLSCEGLSGAAAAVRFRADSVTFPVTYTAALSNGVSLNVDGSGPDRTIRITQTQAGGGNGGLFGSSNTYVVTVTATTASGSWTAASETRIRSSRAGLFFGSTDISCI